MNFFSFSLLTFLTCTVLNYPIGVFASSHEVTPLPKKVLPTSVSSYEKPPHVSQEIWDRVKPYFLPTNSSIKAQLDTIFTSHRVLISLEGFKKAGFSKYKIRKWSRAVVARHPKLKGVVIKAYLDTEKVFIDWEKWLSRIEGAQGVRDCVARHGYEKYFKVPLKWIYPLPAKPSPPLSAEYSRQNFVLVAQEIDILKRQDNLNAWKMGITPEILDAIYTILNAEGLSDSIIPSNIPFTKDGRMAFVDTEHHHKWPVPYSRITQYLSPPMQHYWKMLINNKGPKRMCNNNLPDWTVRKLPRLNDRK
jgi:hypothetical protein